uniref:Neuropeptide-like 4 n=1 Tax=Anopheles epiroticus TaxID=199890 RepID=A0A182PG08_9DIPT
MARKFVIAVIVAIIACTLAAPAPEPKPDPKAQLLAAAPVGYAAYPYAYTAGYVPYSGVLPYTAYAYPSLAYSYNYPYAIV